MSLFHRAALATLTTLIIVLSVLIAFEMNARKEHKEFIVLVDEDDFEAPDPFVEEKKMEELDKSIEEMLKQEEYIDNRRNIAVNKANDPSEDEYTQTKIQENQTEEEYRQQLIKNAIGESDYDKYITNRDTYEEEEIVVPKESKPQDVKKTVYTGPSNIIFYLDNRELRYINIPVYLCQGSATITINIIVNAGGSVTKAQINESESNSNDKCFLEAAYNAASKARFSTGNKSQNGKITFHFVAQ
jgi:TonB family protein